MKNHIRSLLTFLLLAAYCLLLLLMCACSPSFSEDAFAQCPSVDDAPSLLSINELLFNPLGDGVDYVELVNVSSDTLEMSRFRIANRNSKAEVANVKTLSSKRLPPGAYVLLCSDTAWLTRHYYLPDSANVLLVKALPSYANASGCVVLLDAQSDIVDEFPYDEDYHHPLVSDAEALSLEKRHPCLSSVLPSSWTTAALDKGGGTPGYVNSQYRDGLMRPSEALGFSLVSAAFCPQALSVASQCLLSYRLDDSYIASIVVYDLQASPCATIANNLLLGSVGCIAWSGCDDEGKVLFPGTYLLRVQAYALSGKNYSKTFVISILPP